MSSRSMAPNGLLSGAGSVIADFRSLFDGARDNFETARNWPEFS